MSQKVFGENLHFPKLRYRKEVFLMVGPTPLEKISSVNYATLVWRGLIG